MAIYPRPTKDNTCKTTQVWARLNAPSHVKPKLVALDATFPGDYLNAKMAKISMQKSCNLIGWEYLHLSLVKRNFPTYLVFARRYSTISTIILN